jgi:superfamily I DNA/RNA helicase
MPDLPQEVLNSDASKVCVIAAPGAGKTSTILIPKIQQVLASSDTTADQVLLLTFSRMSAADLKQKVSTLDKIPRASTVHSYSLSFLLSENNHAIRQRINNILLDFEKDTLIHDLKISFSNKSVHQMRSLLKEFSAGWAKQQQDEIFNEDNFRRAFKQAVINWLIEHEAATMEEIIYHAVQLAGQLPDSRLIDYPKYIFVDEFQDLNRLEQEFVDALGRNSELTMVVGDPDQSIYSFKYAHREGITEFAAREDVDNFEWNICKRCPVSVINLANQLLLQGEPSRTNLLVPLEGAREGQVRFVRKNFQEEEFEAIVTDLAAKLAAGAQPSSFLILTPKKKLGAKFAEYANSIKQEIGIQDEFSFVFAAKPEFSTAEKQRILLLSLVVKPDSLLHFRAYLGMSDEKHFAKEIVDLKAEYGDLRSAFDRANSNDFPVRNTRVRRLCEQIIELKQNIRRIREEETTVDDALESILPLELDEIKSLRMLIDSLREDGDTLEDIYDKFLDYSKDIPTVENGIRIMTVMASKGLDADHVYILGCNNSNIPGQSRPEGLSAFEHRKEQLRLLFVGVTRAKQSLMISWSRHIPLQQAYSQHTPGVATVRHNGNTYTVVGLSDFLIDLNDINWEN